ncbi:MULTISPECIES: YtxH domain-containing protein [unclassified Exiguobacterium]|uniref:YtxH domain-containing protein n=1 Tax=unclassified Exiguobacterium TaxID=2644629 RepID=UPI001BEB7FF9|nr:MULTISPECIES: YtxH domain-containing protein [unclassified Exiguobacterium]
MTDQKQSTEQNQSSSGFLTGVILGGIVGAAVALLTSPKNGREVRTYLDEKTSTSRERLTVKSKEMREKAEPVLGEWIKVASDKAAPVLNIVKDKAREAAELKQQIDEDELSIEEAMEKADQLVAEAESEVKEQMDRAAEEEKPSNASDSESDDSLEAPVNELLDEESKEELEDLKKDLKKNE